jgi:hypothetical protein
MKERFMIPGEVNTLNAERKKRLPACYRVRNHDVKLTDPRFFDFKFLLSGFPKIFRTNQSGGIKKKRAPWRRKVERKVYVGAGRSS